MTFKDIFKSSFLDSLSTTGNLGLKGVIVALLVCSALALYIFFVYRIVTKKTFYSRSFNISIAGTSVITAAIILTIQSNIVLSLGMVGALSIVRFRTAIKDPMDLMFLFWSISVGIICGARFYAIAAILSLVLTIGILVLERIPFAKASMILVVNASDPGMESEITEAAGRYCKSCRVKSRNLTKQTMDLTMELRTDQEADLIRAVTSLEGVDAASLLSHDGEVTF